MPKRARYLVVFIAALVCLGTLAGRKLWKPSVDNHYSHMAQGWLEGRSSLAGRPPHGNDWGKVTTVVLRDGREIRGYPCRTESCKEVQKREHVSIYWATDREWVRIPRSEIRTKRSTWYVTFPPGPALLMAPGVALWGLGFWDVLFTAICGALVPMFLVRFLDRERGLEQGRSREHLWVAAAWTLASPAAFVAANGSVWFTAQILGALFLVLYIDSAWNGRQPLMAGVWLGLATACRVPVLFAAPLWLFEWWRTGRSPSKLVRFAVPVIVAGLSMAWLNWARFDDPLEFGHRFLDIAWQPRIQEIGLFSHHYLWRNLQCAFFLLPQMHTGAPRWSIHGMSLFVSTPWLLLVPFARDAYPQRIALWVCAGVVAVPALLYQNTGQMQFSYRFALDWLPLVLVAIAFGGGTRRRAFAALVVIGAAIGMYGAWMFAHRPGRLFVNSLWPFEG